jgi:hypothetical protein
MLSKWNLNIRWDLLYLDVSNEKARVLIEDEWKIDTRVRKVLGKWITDSAIVDKVTQQIVMATQTHAYGDIMERIGYFQFKGTSTSL